MGNLAIQPDISVNIKLHLFEISGFETHPLIFELFNQFF